MFWIPLIAGILYGLSCIFFGMFLLIPFSMMSGDPIPPKNWVWWFYIPAVLTWPLAPFWIHFIEWIDDHLPMRGSE